MANPTNGTGLKAICRTDGLPLSVLPLMFRIPATETSPVYPRDPMKLSGADLEVILFTAATTSGIRGVVAQVFDSNMHPLPDPNASAATLANTGSTLRYCTLYDANAPIIYEIREDSDTSSLAVTDIGNNCDLIPQASNAGNAIENTSGWYLDSNTKGTGTLHCRIVGFSPKTQENDPTLDNKLVLVTIFETQAAV